MEDGTSKQDIHAMQKQILDGTPIYDRYTKMTIYPVDYNSRKLQHTSIVALRPIKVFYTQRNTSPLYILLLYVNEKKNKSMKFYSDDIYRS